MSARTPGRRTLLAALAGLAVLAILILSLTLWRERLLAIFVRPRQVESLVDRLGPAGPLAIVLLQMVQVLLAPVPGQVVGLASGYLYGPWLGTLYSMAGLFLGSLMGVSLVRRWGRPLLARLVDPAALARVDRMSEHFGLPLLFLAFLLPFLPDDTILLAAGLTDLPVASIMLAALLGRLPGVFVSSWMGRTATSLTQAQWLGIVAATVAAAVPVYRWRAPLERWMWSLLERLARRRKPRYDRPDRDP